MASVRLRLESVVASPARARRFVADTLDEWGSQVDRATRDTAILLVSELVTNAVIHARSEVDVVVEREKRAGQPTGHVVGELLRVEVRDGSPVLPGAAGVPASEESGRGLALVEALSQRWGVAATATGKTVWFELAAHS